MIAPAFFLIISPLVATSLSDFPALDVNASCTAISPMAPFHMSSLNNGTDTESIKEIRLNILTSPTPTRLLILLLISGHVQ